MVEVVGLVEVLEIVDKIEDDIVCGSQHAIGVIFKANGAVSFAPVVLVMILLFVLLLVLLVVLLLVVVAVLVPVELIVLLVP